MTGPSQPTRLPQPGDLIGGKYRILGLIGDGGMGTVYEARHEVLGARVALKFVNPDLTDRPGLAQRFLQEARVSATIQSPHVTRVTDVDQGTDGTAWLVMELLSGESLQERLDRPPPLSRDEAIDVALQVASGLEAAHDQGVVHRDLKPDNVFITPTPSGPVIKLLDFGIAKLKEEREARQSLTRPGSVMGTPEYMAPEQAFAADQVDHRADIYSFGVILYEMLTGVRPVDSNDPQTIVEHVIHGRTTRIADRKPDLPPGLTRLVDQMLSPSPEARPSSVREIRLGLVEFAGVLSRAGQVATLVDDSARLSRADVEMRGSRPSGVPKTLPGDEPPRTAPYTAPSTEPGGPAAGAATPGALPHHMGTPMGGGPAPHVMTPPLASGGAQGAPARRRRGVKVAVALVVLGLASGGAVWASRNRALLRDEGPPPMPAAPPKTTLTADKPPVQLNPGLDDDEEPAGPPTRERTIRRRREAPSQPSEPSPPSQGEEKDTPRALPIPSLQLPSALPPLPSGLPTAIPTELPSLPGLPLPRQGRPDESSDDSEADSPQPPSESGEQSPRHL